MEGETTQQIVLAPGGTVGAWLIGGCGFLVALFAMVVAAIPPSDSGSKLLFEVKVVGGAAAFLITGGLVYWRSPARASTAALPRVH